VISTHIVYMGHNIYFTVRADHVPGGTAELGV